MEDEGTDNDRETSGEKINLSRAHVLEQLSRHKTDLELKLNVLGGYAQQVRQGDRKNPAAREIQHEALRRELVSLRDCYDAYESTVDECKAGLFGEDLDQDQDELGERQALVAIAEEALDKGLKAYLLMKLETDELMRELRHGQAAISDGMSSSEEEGQVIEEQPEHGSSHEQEPEDPGAKEMEEEDGKTSAAKFCCSVLAGGVVVIAVYFTFYLVIDHTITKRRREAAARGIAPSHLCNALRVFQCNALQSTQ